MKKKQTFPYPGKYTFVDVEIPNIKNDSICAISMIVAEDGQVKFRHTELINPHSFFSGVNISIHHITPGDVQNKRSFIDFWAQYGQYFSSDYIIAAHNTLSDINVMDRDLSRFGLSFPGGYYLDTMDLVYNQFYHKQTGKGDMKLDHICKNMGIEIEHHNPQSDVNACFEIFHYLYEQGFNDLESYLHEIRIKSRTSRLNTPVKKVSEKKKLKDLETRSFKPYFLKNGSGPLDFTPYFDEVTLLDLKNVYLPPLEKEAGEKVQQEYQIIEDFIDKISGTIHQDEKDASCKVEFFIPKAEEFLEYRKKGIKLLHSLDVIDFISRFEQASVQDPELLLQTIYQSRLSRLDESELSNQEACRLGIEAYKEKNTAMAVFYLELAASRGSGNLRIYRLLADLYQVCGFVQEEKRILSKGIHMARRRKKPCLDLLRRRERLLKKTKE